MLYYALMYWKLVSLFILFIFGLAITQLLGRNSLNDAWFSLGLGFSAAAVGASGVLIARKYSPRGGISRIRFNSAFLGSLIFLSFALLTTASIQVSSKKPARNVGDGLVLQLVQPVLVIGAASLFVYGFVMQD